MSLTMSISCGFFLVLVMRKTVSHSNSNSGQDFPSPVVDAGHPSEVKKVSDKGMKMVRLLAPWLAWPRPLAVHGDAGFTSGGSLQRGGLEAGLKLARARAAGQKVDGPSEARIKAEDGRERAVTVQGSLDPAKSAAPCPVLSQQCIVA